MAARTTPKNVSALHELEINNEQLERDLNRALRDRDKSDAAKTEYEQRSTQFEESKSRINAQKVRIDALVLRAPLDGMVLRRDGEVGEIVGPTDVLFWVGPPAPMQVVAEINEEEITRIAVGQKAFLRSEAFSAQALRATVSQITPKGDPTRKTFRVYLLLPRDTPLRIGMTVEVNIIYREKTAAVVVPAEAVVGNAVQVVSDGKVQRVPVTVGIRGSRNVEIVGNVSKDTDGAVTGAHGYGGWHAGPCRKCECASEAGNGRSRIYHSGSRPQSRFRSEHGRRRDQFCRCR